MKFKIDTHPTYVTFTWEVYSKKSVDQIAAKTKKEGYISNKDEILHTLIEEATNYGYKYNWTLVK